MFAPAVPPRTFLLKRTSIIRQGRVVLFQDFSGAREHLSAVHVAAIRKMPDGSRSHGAFLDKRDGLGRCGVNPHCSGVAGREQIEPAAGTVLISNPSP